MTKEKLFAFFATMAFLLSCSKYEASNQMPSIALPVTDQNPPQGTPARPIEPPAPTPPLKEKYSLLWEPARPNDGKKWSDFILAEIETLHATKLLPGTQDIAMFCPKYFQLTTQQKYHFWGMLISGIARYESGFSPVARMKETTMGTDPITKKPVYSEGLLQLSYQDIQMEPDCNFNWESDRRLPPDDPRKTILNPYQNLSCGLKILTTQVNRKNKIALPYAEGAYWAVLIPGGKFSKVKQISQLIQTQMPVCR